MNELYLTNNTSTISSLEVADMVNKDHAKLMRDIRRYIKQFNQSKIGFVDFFIESTYTDAKGENRPCFNITRKGCEFIANKLTGQKGTEFTARYVNRFHELEEGSLSLSLVNTLNTVTKTLESITIRLDNMEMKIENSEQITVNEYKKPYNPWYAKMQPKYKLLEEYFNITRGQLYRNILMELENVYDIDTQQIQADYCYENNLTSCYPLDPYEFVPKYRDMIEQIVNSNLIKFKIASEDDPITSTKHMTIFDRLVN